MASTTRVVVGSFTPSVVLDVARSSGALDARGLSVDEVPVPSSPGQFGALVSGEMDVALTSPDNVLGYRFDPENPLGTLLDTRIVTAVDRGLGLGVYGRPGSTPADVRGSRVGVDVPGSGFALALYELLDRIGVPREAYDLVSLGATPMRLRALLAGDCAATMLGAGNELAAEEEGCVRLARLHDHLAPYLGTVVAVVGDAHLGAARRLGLALADAAEEIVAGPARPAATEAAARLLGLAPSSAERYVERLVDPLEGLVPDGAVDPAALDTLVRLRTRWLPRPLAGGGDALDRARDDAGLVDAG
jgi:ABC-type nitrate/sulfonate/bicarbonate transport system substrate-binding protein